MTTLHALRDGFASALSLAHLAWAFVGVTLFRSIFGIPAEKPITLGLQRRERFEGARVFVLPNPSGRNANYTYDEMLNAFVALRRCADRKDSWTNRQSASEGNSNSE